MKQIRKIIKKMLATIGILIGVIIITGILFMNFSPQFGGTITDEQKAEYAKSPNHNEKKFTNIDGVTSDMSARDMLKAIGGMFKTIPNAKPTSIPLEKIDSLEIANYNAKTRFVWFGHSTFLLQMDGKSILIDPMFGDVPAPHPLLGGKRFGEDLPIEIEKLPKIDAVLISHDHYDHLDYGSIKKLHQKVEKFYTPLGLGNHLISWGVPKEKVVELDWWQEASLHNLKFASTPAQHFSGRGFTDRDQTLWCSWVIESETEKVFFSGDSGYANHFKEIGNKYGPFDFAMIECGQYNELWSEIHMFPEETAQAGIDVQAKKVMPIHWGAFKLAPHSWTDPIERVAKKAKELNLELITPKIGEAVIIENATPLNNPWWKGSDK